MVERSTSPHIAVPLIVVVDAHDDLAVWLGRCLGEAYEVVRVAGLDALQTQTRGMEPAVVVVGEQAGSLRGEALVREVQRILEGLECSAPLFSLDHGLGDADELGLFFVLHQSLSSEDIRALFERAIVDAARDDEEAPIEDAARMRAVLAVSGQFASSSSLRMATRIAIRAATDFAGADRAYCLFYDPDSGSLWSEDDDEREGRASRGLAGFAARTGRVVLVEHASEDVRYDGSLDDPAGQGRERILALPIAGSKGQVHAVIVCVRAPDGPPFSSAERSTMALFAEKSGPTLDHLAQLVEAEAELRAERGDDGLFREEAVANYASAGERGDVVRVSPSWVTWSFWILVVSMTAGFSYLFVGEIDHYSQGVALVRLRDRTDVTARTAGTISEIAVHSGEKVEQGQVLAQLDDSEARAERSRLRRAFEAQLRRRMLDPGNAGVTQALMNLRTQLEAAEDALERREIRAPHAGVVSDVRLRSGQPINVGDVILSLTRGADEFEMIAAMPGGDRPMFEPGMTIRLELGGYRYAYQELVIDSVEDEIIGPNAVRRFLGPKVADAMQLPGPVVLVRAKIHGNTFIADDEVYAFHDGMPATAEVRIRSEPIMVTLFPVLKRLDYRSPL